MIIVLLRKLCLIFVFAQESVKLKDGLSVWELFQVRFWLYEFIEVASRDICRRMV